MTTIALAGLSSSEASKSAPEVEMEQTNEKLTRVKITQTNLADDSLTGRCYLVEFAPYSEQTAKQWQIVWVGEQFKCQAGRGHQDWSADLCQ